MPAALVQPILSALHHATVPAEELLAGLGARIAASVPQELVRVQECRLTFQGLRVKTLKPHATCRNAAGKLGWAGTGALVRDSAHRDEPRLLFELN